MPGVTLNDIRLFSLEQYEAFSVVGQIDKLETRRVQAESVNAGMSKGIRGVVNSINSKISILRRGADSEQEMAEAELESRFGQNIGAVSDSALQSMGFEKRD